MEFRVEEYREALLAGMSFFGNPFAVAGAWDADNEIGSLWRRYGARASSMPRSPGTARAFELHIRHADSARTGAYEVFVGHEVDDWRAVPTECCMKLLPRGRYLVVTASGRDLGSGAEEAIADYAAGELGARLDPAFHAVVYDARFKGMDRLDESLFEFWQRLEDGA